MKEQRAFSQGYWNQETHSPAICLAGAGQRFNLEWNGGFVSMRSMHGTRRRAQASGFTLIEIMVVVVILGILAAMVLPKVVQRTSDAKKNAAKSDISTIVSQLEQFFLDTGRYPTTEEGLPALLTAPSSEGTDGATTLSGWKGPYLNKLPKDPWGNDYVYESPGTVNTDSYDLLSYGADNAEGGEGDNADIQSWTDVAQPAEGEGQPAAPPTPGA